MTREQLREQLKTCFESDTDLHSFRQLLLKYKNEGGDQKTAEEELEMLRAHFSTESIEDRILEVLDINSGFCIPSMRVWEGE